MHKFLMRIAFGFATVAALSGSAWAEGEKAEPHGPHHPWHFGGLTGQHDISQVQRGFQVFWTKCAACHGMEFRRFWHLEQIGYAEGEVRNMITDFMAGQGETFDPTFYSVINMPSSRAEGAPDLSHAVLAKGKTMESGADYIYSLLLGYDRAHDAVLGNATQIELQEDDGAYVQIASEEKNYEDGLIKSRTQTFAKDNFYLYGEGDDWVLRTYRDIRVDFQTYGEDGTANPLETSYSFELLETDPSHERHYAADHENYTALETAEEAWSHRADAHFHEIANWATGQFYNPFKSGGVISMRSPLVDLESFHRTDFTALGLVEDSADLENASYWLLANQDLQESLLEMLPALKEAYAAVPNGDIGALNDQAVAFAAQARGVEDLISQMQPESKEAIAEDVTAFLAWSSDINLNSRKRTGLWIVLILGLLSVLLYYYYREVAKQEFAKQAKYGGPWDDNH